MAQRFREMRERERKTKTETKQNHRKQTIKTTFIFITVCAYSRAFALTRLRLWGKTIAVHSIFIDVERMLCSARVFLVSFHLVFLFCFDGLLKKRSSMFLSFPCFALTFDWCFVNIDGWMQIGFYSHSFFYSLFSPILQIALMSRHKHFICRNRWHGQRRKKITVWIMPVAYRAFTIGINSDVWHFYYALFEQRLDIILIEFWPKIDSF